QTRSLQGTMKARSCLGLKKPERPRFDLPERYLLTTSNTLRSLRSMPLSSRAKDGRNSLQYTPEMSTDVEAGNLRSLQQFISSPSGSGTWNPFRRFGKALFSLWQGLESWAERRGLSRTGRTKRQRP